MRAFVAGASGAIGRPLIPKLVAAGHEVTGMTRSEGKADAIRGAGADVAVVDVFDAGAVRAAVDAASAEVVVHQLTALPDRLDFRKRDLYEPTNRVRTEGTRNLLEAARAAGARRFVCQSIAFAYGEDGAMVADARRRRLPVVGKGTGVFSFIHVDDAADATVAAVERGSPGIYNVVDDEPAPLSEWVRVLAEAVGARRPLRVPLWLARMVGGRQAADFASELRGASNQKAKRELGWQPAHPGWRTGFPESLS